MVRELGAKAFSINYAPSKGLLQEIWTSILRIVSGDIPQKEHWGSISFVGYED